MTPLETMRTFLRSYPEAAAFDAFRIDYTDQVPSNAALFPSGLAELERHTDILGNVRVVNQYNFALWCVFPKPPGDDEAASFNADWVMGLQQWVQEQSIMGKAPAFGDEPRTERITAQNGVLFDADAEGTALYTVQVSVQFAKFFER